MEGTSRGPRTYYRGAARTMVPGSPALNGPPTNVYLPEAAAMDRFNKWIDGLFDRANLDNTVSALIASQEDDVQPTRAWVIWRLVCAATRGLTAA